MKFYSTNNKKHLVGFKEAVIKGLPADNGLFMPESIPTLPKDFFNAMHDMSFHDIAYNVAYPFLKEELSEAEIKEIITETLSFDIPVVEVEPDVYSLELFHGPTCAFKDVGARFLARCLSHFSDVKSTVLVATSGDTGSAVANGFLGVENVDVVILYPKGKVSHLQEQQLTTLGQNITALEVDGTFDDCQRLVKSAFLDEALNQKFALTSANSINIARLLPQSFYYFWALAQLDAGVEYSFSIPSGNYGNLTAGLLAKHMGLPIKQFIASANRNDIVPQYLHTGIFDPRASIQTISNAMDVGDPSNFKRMLDLYDGSLEAIQQDIAGASFTDEETQSCMKAVYEQTGYVLDPHGAVGYLGLQKNRGTTPGIFLETAHPAKFIDVVEDTIGGIDIPERLKAYLDKEKQAINMSSKFEAFKGYLLSTT